MKRNVLILFGYFLILTLSSAVENHLLPAQAHYLTSQSHLAVTSGGGFFGNIFGGFILSPLVFFCAIVCIWFNEKRAAIDSRRLSLASEICENVDVTSKASAIQEDGRLVYAFGQTYTTAVIKDLLSGVFSPNLIKISRVVEVLQWRKHTRKENNTEVEYYQLEWVSSNSQNQGQRFNLPAAWFISSDVTYNPQVYLGGYNIDKTTAQMCNKALPFTPSIEHAQSILMNTGRKDRIPSVNGEYLYFTPYQTGMPTSDYNQPNPMATHGEGTLRVRFVLCPTGEITICARSSGATFSSFPIAQYEGTTEQNNSVPDCCCCCISACYAELLKPIEFIHLVQETTYSKQEMFNLAVEKSECFTRVVRIGCYALLVLSICLFFSPITNLLGYIPLVGGIVSGIVGFAIFLAAVLVCIPIFFLVTSIAWVRYRPKVGLVILFIGVAILTTLLIINSNKGGGVPATTQSHAMTLMRFPHE